MKVFEKKRVQPILETDFYPFYFLLEIQMYTIRKRDRKRTKEKGMEVKKKNYKPSRTLRLVIFGLFV